MAGCMRPLEDLPRHLWGGMFGGRERGWRGVEKVRELDDGQVWRH
jgi:hypothetical protein